MFSGFILATALACLGLILFELNHEHGPGAK